MRKLCIKTLITFVVASVVFAAALAPASAATTYTGTLTNALVGGIVTTGAFLPPPNSFLTWTATQETPGTPWCYSYTLSVPAGGCDLGLCMLLETSPSFSENDIFNVVGASSYQIGTWTEEDCPGIPDTLYGLRFQLPSATSTFSFCSIREPMWGDFFASGQRICCPQTLNTAYNAGFTEFDTDPTAPPSNGSLQYHVLVPDTVIPEANSFALAAMGLVPLFGFKKRFRK